MSLHPLNKPTEAMSRSPLLLIDDNIENVKLLERTLEWGGFVNVRSCLSAKAGLVALASFDPHLIILDLNMPEMNGFEFLEYLRKQDPKGSFLSVLVFTADLNPESKIRALELGASDFLTKPGDPIEIQLRVLNFLRTRQLQIELQNQNLILEANVEQRTEQMLTAQREAVEVLSRASEYRDDETGLHACRVGELASTIAKEMGLQPDFVESLRLVAPLHDVGKIGIPDVILKKPGKLSAEEFEVMKSHVDIGAKLLSGKTSPLLHLAHEIAKYHHERWDGTGYLSGLSGEAIPMSARIVSVADAFDAMTHDRPYRQKMSRDIALQELLDKAGSQFDPAVVEAVFRLLRPQGHIKKSA